MPLSDTFCFSGPCRTVDSGATSLGNWNNTKQHNFLEDQTESWKTEKHETTEKELFWDRLWPPPPPSLWKLCFFHCFSFFSPYQFSVYPPTISLKMSFCFFSFFQFFSVFGLPPPLRSIWKWWFFRFFSLRPNYSGLWTSCQIFVFFCFLFCFVDFVVLD
jgi:hypothetical protein